MMLRILRKLRIIRKIKIMMKLKKRVIMKKRVKMKKIVIMKKMVRTRFKPNNNHRLQTSTSFQSAVKNLKASQQKL